MLFKKFINWSGLCRMKKKKRNKLSHHLSCIAYNCMLWKAHLGRKELWEIHKQNWSNLLSCSSYFQPCLMVYFPFYVPSFKNWSGAEENRDFQMKSSIFYVTVSYKFGSWVLNRHMRCSTVLFTSDLANFAGLPSAWLVLTLIASRFFVGDSKSGAVNW